MTHVQGHKVKYSNRNNSTADCSIALKFGTEVKHGTAGILQMLMFKVKGQRSRSQGHRSRSQRNVTPVERLRDFKLDMGVVIKACKDWRGVGRPSSCNAFAIATFSSRNL